MLIADESLIDRVPSAIGFDELGAESDVVASGCQVIASDEHPVGARRTSTIEVEHLRGSERPNPRTSTIEVEHLPGSERPDPRTSTTEVDRSLGPADVRCILFTSGTTGVPKGAELTVGNFAASARASAENLGGDSDQIWLGCLPLFHVGGIALIARAAEYGASVILQRGFDVDSTLRAIFEQGVTHISLVPTALRRLLETRRSFPRSLRAALIGGGPVDRQTLLAARNAGIPAVETYGLTEACSQVATESPIDPNGMRPLPGTEIRVIDGEVQVRGPTVMRGYFRDPAATSAAFIDGWLRTGDLGSSGSDGTMVIHSRRTDLIVTGGENVYPAEVEAALSSHDQVRDVAVTGMAHAEWGQTVVAVIVGTADDRTLALHCRSRLAGFKVPRRFVRAESIPRNANGKVDRIALRNLVQKFL
ncbi:MAG: class I adenylate-forming enzyme family protein [Myxococcaceae bacterium]